MTLPQIIGLGAACLVSLIFLAAGFLTWYERRNAEAWLDWADEQREATKKRPIDGAEVYDPRGRADLDAKP